MSGGVDSSVAAALMVEQGFKVIGLTMQLYDHGLATQKANTCCAGRDIHDARQVASCLNIPHYVLDYESRFKRAVIDDFADSYLSGLTPIPCIRCNQRLKFSDLLETAKELDAQALITGHYVRRLEGNSVTELHKAKDVVKDQSYFLFTTTLQQLEYLRFPLGDLTKKETRAIAARYNLPIANKPDSQDICFIPDGDYARTVERLRPGASETGNLVLEDGTIVGKHPGIIHFTVGQRRGLGVSWHEPLYVLRVARDRNEIVVGPKTSLKTIQIMVKDVNWLDPDLNSPKEDQFNVKIRSGHPGTSATVEKQPNGRAKIKFNTNPGAVSPGQAAVFYKQSRLVGGGWIEQNPTNSSK